LLDGDEYVAYLRRHYCSWSLYWWWAGCCW